ncbi:MAG: OmpH family outer membrane protein [Prevotellaceae bacterium]|jgi:outer membrane protein|nr:OmpH family outer membrane protein [Prevotellaceae bacterium]
MKRNLLLIANIVLAVAVAALYVFYFTGICNKKPVGSVASEIALHTPSGAIVYIQVDSLVNALDLFHDLRSEWEAKAKVIDDDLTKKGRTFERDYNDFVEKVQKGLITRAQAETQGAQLEARQRDLQQYSQKKQMELAEEEQVVLNNVIYEIKKYLTAYNAEHNFSLILATNGTPGIILEGDTGLDITKDIVLGLNALYATQHNKKK